MADDPQYGVDDQVVINADRFEDFLDTVVAMVATNDGGIDALQQRIDNYRNPPPVPKPTLSLSAPITKVEGDTGTTEYRWTLTLDPDGSTDTFPYSYAVTGFGSNQASAADFGGAYPAGSGTISAGDPSKAVVILAYADRVKEPDEQFKLTVSAAGMSDVSSIGTIANDDNDPVPAFVFSGPTTIAEGTPAASVPAFAFAGPSVIVEGNDSTPVPAFAFSGPEKIAEGNPDAIVPGFVFTGPGVIAEGNLPTAQYTFAGPATINEGSVQ